MPGLYAWAWPRVEPRWWSTAAGCGKNAPFLVRQRRALRLEQAGREIMMQKIHLSREEELVLEPILASMSRKAGHPLTLASLLERWENFVSEVEEGYDDSIYEYTNDLSVRDLLQVVVDNSPISFRDKLIGALWIWDERFKKATEASKRSVLPNKEKSQAWWWFRVPKKPGSELKNDLQLDKPI